MTADGHTIFPEQIPAELTTFVRTGAELGRRRVAEFLRLGEFRPEDFDPRVVVALTTVTQLQSWDRAGIVLPRRLGLPTWQAALTELAAAMLVTEADPARLDAFRRIDLAVFQVWVEWFAWAGPTELQTEVALDFPDEDRFVDALAAFLWANRHSLSPQFEE